MTEGYAAMMAGILFQTRLALDDNYPVHGAILRRNITARIETELGQVKDVVIRSQGKDYYRVYYEHTFREPYCVHYRWMKSKNTKLPQYLK